MEANLTIWKEFKNYVALYCLTVKIRRMNRVLRALTEVSRHITISKRIWNMLLSEGASDIYVLRRQRQLAAFGYFLVIGDRSVFLYAHI
ncbi:hypothetical protein TNIN_427571 [Trichonephila inaurata madagascariensis]|uniref:Uncharacterized protein n=1 Tax=Trichonephila inaurata madagascariensis TaxID=2747483 RepID=A0A8X6IML3_9ARAC|nr:hypothetical protein TNIN_427571 [Trichonephila inaurata madagascariensis]